MELSHAREPVPLSGPGHRQSSTDCSSHRFMDRADLAAVVGGFADFNAQSAFFASPPLLVSVIAQSRLVAANKIEQTGCSTLPLQSWKSTSVSAEASVAA